MYAAYNCKGELVYAEQVARWQKEKEPSFFCPTCSLPVYLKCSRRGKYYFAHRHACQSKPVARTYAETEKHKRAKTLIQAACQSNGMPVECEYYLPAIQQTADIYLPSEQLVIEFQHSPISAQEVSMRTKHYQQLGLRVIWLLDADCFRKGYRSGWQQMMVQLNDCHELYWHMLDVDTARLTEWRQLAILYRKNYRAHLSETLTLPDWVANGFMFPRRSHTITVKRQHKACYLRRLTQLQQSPSYQQALQSLYQAGTILQEVPQWVISEPWQCLLTKSPGWLVLAWCYTLIQRGTPPRQAYAQLAKQLEWVELPLVSCETTRWVMRAACQLYAKRSSCPRAQQYVTLLTLNDKGA